MRLVAAILADLSGLQTDSEGFTLPGGSAAQGGHLEVRRHGPVSGNGGPREPALVYHGPKHLLTTEIVREIKGRRAEIIRWLESNPSSWSHQDRCTLGFGPDAGSPPDRERGTR